MRILVTGSNGLLGQKIIAQLERKGVEYLATSKGENRNSNCPNSNYTALDITNQKEINALFEKYQPTDVINTAAMTNVDACEADEINCRKINVDAVKYLFEACKSSGAYFVQVSTDFVFDGENGPYVEGDDRNPLSIYGVSKVDAENILIKDEYKHWSILRTIIVFGEGENLSRSNIVLWAKEALKEGKALTIVDDQFRSPTWADDLAWACIQACICKAENIYHISGPESFSIYDLVIRIASYFGLDHSNIQPIKSAVLNQKAKRPPCTGFIIDRAAKELNYRPLSFEESLSLLS